VRGHSNSSLAGARIEIRGLHTETKAKKTLEAALLCHMSALNTPERADIGVDARTCLAMQRDAFEELQQIHDRLGNWDHPNSSDE
jgi:hypothetical protein